jgi:N-acyl-D-amino-acid deacylase
MTDHDVIVRGGVVYDGTGAAPQHVDIGISEGLISGVGRDLGTAGREIDATGCIVTPGWVDIHTHYDGQVTWDPTLAPSSWHGVTTTVMGNCGVGFAPIRPGREQFLIELMEGVEDIPGTALAEGITWAWEHFPEYLDTLDKLELSMDVGTQVPHAPVRAYVLGDRCNTDYQPSAEEIAEMARLVRQGLDAGALGFSTSRTLLHRDIHGVEMPGTFAGSDELLSIGRAMRGLQHGVFQLVSDHLGDQDEWTWLEQVAEQSGRPITLVPTSELAYRDDLVFRKAEDATRRGLEIWPQVAGRPTCVLHGLQSSHNIFAKLPTFRRHVAGRPLQEQVAILRAEATRHALMTEFDGMPQELKGYVEGRLWQVFPLGDNPDYEPAREASVAATAQAQDRPAVEVMYDLLITDDGRELFYQPLGLYDTFDFEFFERAIGHPASVFGLSDGGAHCGVIADAGMPTFVLTHWGRDRNRGKTFPLEWLVRKLSRDTARAYGLRDRGELTTGKLGDVNIIDFDRLRLHRPEARNDLPAGGRRLVQQVDGYRYVLKRGEPIITDGQLTDARPGRLIRGGTA